MVSDASVSAALASCVSLALGGSHACVCAQGLACSERYFLGRKLIPKQGDGRCGASCTRMLISTWRVARAVGNPSGLIPSVS